MALTGDTVVNKTGRLLSSWSLRANEGERHETNKCRGTNESDMKEIQGTMREYKRAFVVVLSGERIFKLRAEVEGSPCEDRGRSFLAEGTAYGNNLACLKNRRDSRTY